MPIKTKGFVNVRQLNRHFAKHGADFGVSTAAQYETLADSFLGGPKAPDVRECTRKKGDILRFNVATDAYGVLGQDNVIRTFYKPVPCATLPAAARIAIRQAGDCHHYASNLLYFQSECARW